jgi:hypothetical protein
LFSSLHAGQLELFCLNFGEIVLLPKVNEAERIQQYRPICLLNVSFEIFTKVVTLRLSTVADCWRVGDGTRRFLVRGE